MLALDWMPRCDMSGSVIGTVVLSCVLGVGSNEAFPLMEEGKEIRMAEEEGGLYREPQLASVNHRAEQRGFYTRTIFVKNGVCSLFATAPLCMPLFCFVCDQLLANWLCCVRLC